MYNYVAVGAETTGDMFVFAKDPDALVRDAYGVLASAFFYYMYTQVGAGGPAARRQRLTEFARPPRRTGCPRAPYVVLFWLLITVINWICDKSSFGVKSRLNGYGRLRERACFTAQKCTRGCTCTTLFRRRPAPRRQSRRSMRSSSAPTSPSPLAPPA